MEKLERIFRHLPEFDVDALDEVKAGRPIIYLQLDWYEEMIREATRHVSDEMVLFLHRLFGGIKNVSLAIGEGRLEVARQLLLSPYLMSYEGRYSVNLVTNLEVPEGVVADLLSIGLDNYLHTHPRGVVGAKRVIRRSVELGWRITPTSYNYRMVKVVTPELRDYILNQVKVAPSPPLGKTFYLYSHLY